MVQEAIKLQLHPILGDEYLVSEEALGVTHGIAAKITSNRHTQDILKFLSGYLPLKNMAHVKRVRSVKHNGVSSLEIFLMLRKCDNIGEPIGKFLDSTALKNDILQSYPDFDKCSKHLSNIFWCKVATKPPLTREQFDFAKKFWPVAFHEDKNISKIINGTNFSNQQITNIRKFCEMVKIESDSNSAGRALIVDPKELSVVAQSVSMTTQEFDFLDLSKNFKHKLLHPAMVAIDSTARSQGGGVYNYPISENTSLIISKSSSLDSPTEDNGYICTGYDAYLTFEPCVMCSMALLHSRIKRVFYLKPDQNCGALGGKYKLHAMRSLNHRFEVYRCSFST